MKEFDKIFEITLPKKSLAVHGTNLARAKEIEKHGSNNLWYNSLTLQNPLIFTNSLLRQTQRALYESWERAVFKTKNPDYLAGNNPAENYIAALVFLQPLDESANETGYSSKHEMNQIPASNVLGVLPLPNLTFDQWHKMVNQTVSSEADTLWSTVHASLIRSTYSFLKRKGIINSARLPRPQVE